MRRYLAIASILPLALGLASCGDSEGSSAGAPSLIPVAVRTSPGLAPVVEALAEAFEAEKLSDSVNVVTSTPTQLVSTAKTVKAGLVVLPDALLPTGSQGVTSGSLGRTVAVIAVADGNPKRIADPPAFDNPGLRTAVCGTGTPNLMAYVLAKSDTTVTKYTVGATCGTDAVEKIAAGDLDAVLTFRNDVAVPDGVELITIPDRRNVIIEISYLVLGSSAGDRAFGEFLASDDAKDILTEHGYLP